MILLFDVRKNLAEQMYTKNMTIDEKTRDEKCNMIKVHYHKVKLIKMSILQVKT